MSTLSRAVQLATISCALLALAVAATDTDDIAVKILGQGQLGFETPDSNWVRVGIANDSLWSNAKELTLDGVALVERIAVLEALVETLSGSLQTVLLGTAATAPAESCLQLRNLGRLVSGMYWIRPAGYSGAPAQLYCEQTRFSGGWTHIASYDHSFYAYFSNTSDMLEHVYGTDALNVGELHGGFSTIGQNARLSRGFLNALGAASATKAFVLDLESAKAVSGNGTFLQQKLNNVSNPGGNAWTLHEALVNPFVWGGATTGDAGVGNLRVHTSGVDYFISRNATWDENLQLAVGGNNPAGASSLLVYDRLNVTFPGAESYDGEVARHGGLVSDATDLFLWAMTTHPTAAMWTNGVAGTLDRQQRMTVLFK